MVGFPFEFYACSCWNPLWIFSLSVVEVPLLLFFILNVFVDFRSRGENRLKKKLKHQKNKFLFWHSCVFKNTTWNRQKVHFFFVESGLDRRTNTFFFGDFSKKISSGRKNGPSIWRKRKWFPLSFVGSSWRSLYFKPQ